MASSNPIALADGYSIGAGAVIVAGVTVGRFATVGAGSVRDPQHPGSYALDGRQPGTPDRLGVRLRRSTARREWRPGPGRGGAAR